MLIEMQLMDPVERPHLPYTIGAPDWNQFSDSVSCLDERPTEDASDWLYSVLSVFSKVYTVAKIVVTILMQYGVEVCETLFLLEKGGRLMGMDLRASWTTCLTAFYTM